MTGTAHRQVGATRIRTTHASIGRPGRSSSSPSRVARRRLRRRRRPRRGPASPRPPITGTALDGTPIDLAAYRGHPVDRQLLGVVVHAVPRGVPAVQGAARDARADRRAGRCWASCTRTSPSSRGSSLDEFGATWPTVTDPDDAIAKAYRVVAPPQTYFIDADGVLRRRSRSARSARRTSTPSTRRSRRDRARPRRGRTTPDRRRPGRRACARPTRGREILAGVSFEVRRGELFALLGPNGAGKTTTVEILEGYRRPDGGHGAGPRPRPGARRPAPAAADRADAPGGRHRQPVHAARGRCACTPASTATRRTRTGCSRPSTSARVAGTRYRRLSGGEKQRLGARPGAARPAGAAGPRRADRRHGPGGEAGDPRADRGAARRRDDDPAHDPRAGRRRAAGRPRRGPRPRAPGRRRARPPSSPARGAPRVRFRLSRRSTTADAAALAAAVGAGSPAATPRLRGAAPARSYELEGLAGAPDPRLVAAARGLVRGARRS